MDATWAVIYVPSSARRARYHRHRCAAWCTRRGWGVVDTTRDPRHALRLVHDGRAQRIVVARHEHLAPLVPPAVVATGPSLPAAALVVASGVGAWWWARRGGVAVAMAGGLALVPVVVYDPPLPPPVAAPTADPAPTATPEPTPQPDPEPRVDPPPVPVPTSRPPRSAPPTTPPTTVPPPVPSPGPTVDPQPTPGPEPEDVCVRVRLIVGVELCLPG